jgi:hypothetical protein
LGTWQRDWLTEQSWATGQWLCGAIPNGATLTRVLFGYKWIGITSNDASFQLLADDFLAVGLVTQSSAHGSTAPNALGNANNANPPLERWLHWSTVGMTPIVMGSEHPDVMVWSTDVSRETLETEGEVVANVGAGNTLDLYLSWSPWITTGWAANGTVRGKAWASVFYI